MLDLRRSRQKIVQCAENIVHSVNIKNDEHVAIRGGIHAQELLEEIGLHVYRTGGLPVIFSTSDQYKKAILHDKGIKIRTLQKTPAHLLKFTEALDVNISIDPLEDPVILRTAPVKKRLAYFTGVDPIKDVMYGKKQEFYPGKKWIFAGWPTRKAAKFYNVEFEFYEQLLLNGMCVPSEQLAEIGNTIRSLLVNAKRLYIKDDLGSDFWVSVENRRFNIDDGYLSDDKIAHNFVGANLPAGEVSVSPIETKGEGVLICPIALDIFSFNFIKNLELHFKDGKLLLDKVSADKHLDDFMLTFKYAEAKDRRKFSQLRTYNIAELGIGCNPEITRAIGYILTDEKITGTVHIAFGNNSYYGGTSSSSIHWDFVSDPSASITVEYMDGSKKEIMESGKFPI
ncbi:MAG: aminopeptidase [Promethearchaeota archaeon]